MHIYILYVCVFVYVYMCTYVYALYDIYIYIFMHRYVYRYIANVQNILWIYLTKAGVSLEKIF